MPNDVTTRCIVSGPAQRIAAFKEQMIIVCDDGPIFDFERVTAMPAHIRNTAIVNRIVYFQDADIDDEDARTASTRPLTADELALGAGEGWYKWSVRNWGTKWNSYHFMGRGDIRGGFDFEFITAGRFPMPIFEKLAARFPDLRFHCRCFDEAGDVAGAGHFNAEPAFKFCAPTPELHEEVYGRPPHYDDDKAA